MFDLISFKQPSNEEDPNISGTIKENVAAGLEAAINNLNSGHPFKLGACTATWGFCPLKKSSRWSLSCKSR